MSRPQVILMVRAMDAQGDPAVPQHARLIPMTSGWSTVYVNGTQVHAFKAGQSADGTRGLFYICGPRPLLDQWAAQSDNAWTLSELHAANTTAANQVKRRIPFWRCSGSQTGSFGTRTFTDEIHRLTVPLPITLPTVANPWTMGPLSITQLIRPALPATIFGYTYRQDAEDTTT